MENNRSRQFFSVVTLLILWGLTALWGVYQLNGRRQADALLQNKYNRAFYESLQRTKNVEALLSKGLASSTKGQMDTLFSELWYNANSAQENLHQLPVSHSVVAKTSKFLTQVGDYAYSLTRSNSGTLSEKEWQTMKKLYETSVKVNRELALVQRQAATGRFHWTEVKSGLGRNLAKGTAATADTAFRRLDSQFKEVPTLLYDGPFSDHIEKTRPLGLTGAPVVAARAKEIARSFIDFKGQIPSSSRVVGQKKGKIPAYGIEFRTGNRDTDLISADVSKKGGHVVYFLNPRPVSVRKITDAKASKIAADFLASRQVRGMIPTYYLRERNIMFISFAYKQGDVVIYPDQIKVRVALDNGQVLGYDAQGFLTSHRVRKLPEPKLTAEQAGARLSSRLKMLSQRLAVIPTSGKSEVLAYEFRCTMGGDTFLVYINALNGKEEQIFKLVKLSNGTLAV